MKEESIFNGLAEEFWLWRSDQQPRSHDDIPRIERPDHWVRACWLLLLRKI